MKAGRTGKSLDISGATEGGVGQRDGEGERGEAGEIRECEGWGRRGREVKKAGGENA